MSNIIGMFECTLCKLVFSENPQPNGGWHIVCPNGCTNTIEYNNHPEYKSYNKYFKWLNYDQLFKNKSLEDLNRKSK